MIDRPIYQLLPDLSPEEYAALRQSILDVGVRVPVEFDDAGNVLDGHHRIAICRELGISEFPKRINTGLVDAEKRTLARELNVARRHLNSKQKRDLIDGQLSDTPSLSDRAIAARLGVTNKTVAARRKILEGREEIPHVEERVDILGRSQPAERQKTQYVDNSPRGRAETVARAEIIRRENKEASGVLAAAVGNERNANAADPSDVNLYQSPWVAIDVLLNHLAVGASVWEPALGPGAIGSRLIDHGRRLLASDLIDYSTDPTTGEINVLWEQISPTVSDFLTMVRHPFGRKRVGAIITNPPYNKADQFISKALELARFHKIPVVAMLVRVNFMAGCGDARCKSLEEWKPSRQIIFSRRLPMMHRDDFEGEEASSRLDTCWLIWELDRQDVETTATQRVDWKHDLDLDDDQWRLVMDGAGPEVLEREVAE